MKDYVGIKHIKAEPCEKDGKEGYKVIYENGYESWSPKDVFEKAYAEVEDSMADFVVAKLKEVISLFNKMCKVVDNA